MLDPNAPSALDPAVAPPMDDAEAPGRILPGEVITMSPLYAFARGSFAKDTGWGGVTMRSISASPSRMSFKWYRAAALSIVSGSAAGFGPRMSGFGFDWREERAVSSETRWLISMMRLERVVGERKIS